MQFHPCFQFPGSPQEPWGGRRAGGEGHLRAPRGLGGWGAVVAEHEHEGAGEVVGQGAAAVLVAHREQEEQQQKQEQQQLQGKSHAAQPPAQGAASTPRPHLRSQTGGVSGRQARTAGSGGSGLAGHTGCGFPIWEVGLMLVSPEPKISSFLKPFKA